MDKAGNPVYKASLTSDNLLQFAFPYTGKSAATLTIRRRNNETHVYIEVVNGQFNRSFQGGSARIRFDDKSPITYSLVAAANGRANIVFIDPVARLIAQLKAARTMRVEARFYGQGVQAVTFRVAGLNWSH